MAQCYDTVQQRNVYCSAGYGAYIAVGVILPLAILILTLIISVYLRYKRRRLRRQEQQISMTTVVPIHNTDGEQQPGPYTYSYPPNYTSVIESSFDKPPSYEQTVEYISEINNRSDGTAAAILPITTITPSASTQATQLSRNQT